MPKIGEKTMDVRLVERFIHQGEMKRADYDKYLKSLPDDAENALETRPGDEAYEAELEAASDARRLAKEQANSESQS